MKRYIILICVFLICMGSFSFASETQVWELPVSDCFQSSYYTYSPSNMEKGKFVSMINLDFLGRSDCSYMLKNFRLYYNNVLQKGSKNGGNWSYDFSHYKSGGVFRLESDVSLPSSASFRVYVVDENGVRSSIDRKYSWWSSNFIHPVVSITALPGMVTKQVMPVVGLGILILSLMLSLNLFKKLFHFL